MERPNASETYRQILTSIDDTALSIIGWVNEQKLHRKPSDINWADVGTADFILDQLNYLWDTINGEVQ